MLLLAGAALLLAHPGEAAPSTLSSLRFLDPPSDTAVDITFQPTVRVAAYDQNGALFTGTASVTLTLSGGTSGARLVNGPGQSSASANPVAPLSNGIARFPNVAVTHAGDAYKLVAASGTVTTTSLPFNVNGQFAAGVGTTVGKTSAPWTQAHFNAARTGAFPGAADFSTRTLQSLTVAGGTVDSSPVTVDLNGDGVLDVVVVATPANPGGGLVVRAFNGNTRASLWTYNVPSTVSGSTPAGATASANIALASLAVVRNGGVPYIALQSLYSINAGASSNDGKLTILTSTGAVAGTPTALTISQPRFHSLVADVTGTGDMLVLMHQVGGTASGEYLAAYTVSGSGAQLVFDSILPSIPEGAGLAAFESDSTHAGREVAIAMSNYYVDGGWYEGVVYLCKPSLSGANCNSSSSFPDTAVQGVAAADLDNDGLPELIVTGQEDVVTGNSPYSLSVFKGGSSLPSPQTYLDGFNQGNVAAVGDVGNNSVRRIITAEYGYAPPGSADRQGDTGTIGVRSWSASSIADQGTWTRTGTTESRGGGALLDVNRDGTLEYVFGSADNNLIAATVAGTSGTSPPSALWSQAAPGGTGAGAPGGPVVFADLTGDCRPEILVGLTGGNVAVISGVAAVAPGAPSFTAGTDYSKASSWTAGLPATSPGSGMQAKLAWNRPTSTGGLPITYFTVLRAPATGGTFTQVGIWPSGIAPTPAAPYIDAVPAYGTYRYQVKAVTCIGESVVSDTFTSEVKLPTPPTGLVGTPSGNPAYGPLQVTLAWSAPANNTARPVGCGAVDGYNVYRSTSQPVFAPANRITPTPVTVPRFNDTSASPGLAYFYLASAVNCVGENATGAGIQVSVQYPGRVTSLAASIAAPPAYRAPAGPAVTLSWQPPATLQGCGAIEGYTVYRGPIGGPVAFLANVRPSGPDRQAAPWKPLPVSMPGAVALNFTDSGNLTGFPLQVGQSYSYEVHAVNCVGEGQAAPIDVTLAPPDPASNLVAVANANDTVSLTWDAPASPGACAWLEGYIVERHGGTNASWIPASWPRPLPGSAPAVTPQAHFIDTTTARGSAYTYSVTAVGCAGAASQAPEVPIVVGSNQAPLLLLPSPSILEDASASVAIGYSDDTGDASVERVHLAATGGKLSLSPTGLDFSCTGCAGAPTGSTNLTFQGSVAALRSALATLAFQPTANLCGPASLDIVADDLGNSGAGGPKQATGHLDLAIGCVNDPPSFAIPIPVRNAGAGVANLVGFALQVAPGGGADEAGQGRAFELASVTNATLLAGSPTVRVTATASSTAADMHGSFGFLSFEVPSGAEGIVDLCVVLVDDGGTANGGHDESAPVAPCPRGTPMQLRIAARGLAVSLASTFTAIEDTELALAPTPGASGGEATHTLRMQLAASHGKLRAGSGTPAAALTLTGTRAELAALLDGLRFVPDTDFCGAAGLAISLADTQGSETATASALVSVGCVNDRPVLPSSLGDITVAVDAGTQVRAGFVSGLSAGGGAAEADQEVTLSFATASHANLFEGMPTLTRSASALATTPGWGPYAYLTFTPKELGSSLFCVVATDSEGATSVAQSGDCPTGVAFTITIVASAPHNPPYAPNAGMRILPDGDLHATAGSALATAFRLAEGTATWQASGLPDGARFDAGTQTFTWTPAAAGRLCTLLVTATDAAGHTSQARYCIVVAAGGASIASTPSGDAHAAPPPQATSPPPTARATVLAAPVLAQPGELLAFRYSLAAATGGRIELRSEAGAVLAQAPLVLQADGSWLATVQAPEAGSYHVALVLDGADAATGNLAVTADKVRDAPVAAAGTSPASMTPLVAIAAGLGALGLAGLLLRRFTAGRPSAP